MEATEDFIKKDVPAGKGWKLFSFLSQINTQLIAFVILFLLSIQVFYGIFEPTTTKIELVAIYYGKTLMIRVLGFLGILNGLIDFYCKVFIHRKRALKWTFLKRPWMGFLLILLAWSALAIGASMDQHLAVFGAPYRYEGYLSYLAYAGIFINASLIKKEKYKKILFGTIAVSSSVIAVLTLLKEMANASFLMNRGRQVSPYSATFINPNHYGYYLCVSMIIIAGLFITSEKIRSKILYGICFAINLVVMLFNASLGPYIALALGLIALFIFSWIRKGFKKTWHLLILVAVFIGLSFLLNGQKVIKDIQLLTTQTGDVISVIGSGGADTPEGQQAIDTIGSSRGVLWRKTIDVILANPIIGVGTDSIHLHIDNHIPHNEYLQITANLGFPGIILYLAALISCFAFTIKNIKKISDGTLIAGVGMLVYCISAFVGISIPIATYQLFFCFGLLNSWFKDRDDSRMNEEKMAELNKLVENTQKEE